MKPYCNIEFIYHIGKQDIPQFDEKFIGSQMYRTVYQFRPPHCIRTGFGSWTPYSHKAIFYYYLPSLTRELKY